MQALVRAMALAFCLLPSLASQATPKPLPAALNSMLLLKLLSYEQSLSLRENINILVINDEPLARALKQKTGIKIGQAQLGAVYHNEAPPEKAVHVIYINGEQNLDKTLQYAKTHHALTVSNDLALAHLGVALILHDDEGLPGVVISMKPSRALDLNWDPKVLEISTLIY
ncbi:YfiR/HmsC family protein [Simiduia sp. 21SJ11W-1]|uniref:YfiR/HmsC family protein n=1 Tax=Simiduia sp. 21SJ11W-1 TaxID=2909669 RepID=UPI00209E1184|nr:YfiR/HmsC family protein [Simiduia sp. 21SJ11W-1]UTA49061.1 YfiR/HmsC family protein [Simiduia sp. 21SJ11W-1]